MVFNVMYWVFGFIRMGSSGLTAQAFGRHDLCEAAQLIARASVISLAIALLLMILQWPIFNMAIWIMSPGPEVERYVKIYFDICIW
jgi:MATE family multidrug resistance protein